MRRAALVALLPVLFVAGLAVAAPKPGFCIDHPANPHCVSTSSSASSSSSTSSSSSSTSTSTTTATSTSTSTLTSTSTSTTTTTTRSTGTFGVSDGAGLVYEADATRLRELDSMQAAGAKWARMDFAWSVIEGSPGAFNVGYLDTAVREAQARGMKVLATIAYAPAWANGGRADDKYPPLNPGDYGRVAGKIATHFAPLGVHDYELWNEPNLGCCFWKPTANPDAYAALAKAAYPAIHAADPQAVVIVGALSPAGGYNDANCDGVYGDPSSGGNMNPVNFLERLYALGTPSDAISHHPYDGGGLRFHRCSGWSQMQETDPSLRSVMAAGGDAAKRLWATEYGNQVPAWTDEAGQAQRLTDAMAAWKTYAWAGAFFEFNLWDASGSSYGLLRPDWTQRPAWFSFKVAAS